MLGPVALLVVLCVLAAPVLALVALTRANASRKDSRSDADRLAALERQLGSLQRRLETIERSGASRPAESAAPGPLPQGSRPAPAEKHTEEHPLAARFEPARPTPPPPPLAPPAPPPPRASLFSAADVPPQPPSPPFHPVEWERWIGVRGAAVVGAIALALAGLLFFKYSVEHGLITPVMRVISGTLTGLGCLVGSEWMRRLGYRQAAEGVSGAGVVILYAAFWAAHTRYGLIGMATAFTLMVLVTATCCLLAIRHATLLVAVLGLVGGFATPLMLSSEADRPIGLFGYVLLLDLGLLAVGRTRRWPSLGLLSLVGTFVMQALWIGARMDPGRWFLGLSIVAVFAVLFLASGRLAGSGETASLRLVRQVGSLLFPFAFAVYFAAHTELGPHLYPLALLLGLLGLGACWVAREQVTPALGIGAAAASVAVMAVWLTQHPMTPAAAWETAGAAVGLALVFHLFVEFDPAPPWTDGPAAAAIFAACGLWLVTLFAAGDVRAPILPWLVAWGSLTALLYRHAGFSGRATLQPVAAAGLGAGLTCLYTTRHMRSALPSPALFLAILAAAALSLHGAALLRRAQETRRLADHAAALLPVLLLLGLAASPFTASMTAQAAIGTALVLGFLSLLAATRLGEGGWLAAAIGATWLTHLSWTWGRSGLADRPSETTAALGLMAVAVILFTIWPFLGRGRFLQQPLAWQAAAVAGPLWFMPLRRLWVWTFGDGWIGLLPIGLGTISLAAAVGANRLGTAAVRKSALTWLAAAALCFFALAIPLQLEKEWITIGWALEGFAVLLLWRRLDHPGLKYFGLALLCATTIRLVANVELLGYHPRSSVPIVNWLAYTYLVPAAALLGAWMVLRVDEVSRAQPWETIYGRGHPMGAIGAGLGGVAVIFVWMNLAIADWFATDAVLRVDLGGPPAQRLTVSIAWGTYALVLLGFGMARDTLGLRWLSLGFLFVTIGKVFLYDLGTLRDLYRVASLVGLAVSLILVSVLYQRFVFGRSRTSPESS